MSSYLRVPGGFDFNAWIPGAVLAVTAVVTGLTLASYGVKYIGMQAYDVFPVRESSAIRSAEIIDLKRQFPRAIEVFVHGKTATITFGHRPHFQPEQTPLLTGRVEALTWLRIYIAHHGGDDKNIEVAATAIFTWPNGTLTQQCCMTPW